MTMDTLEQMVINYSISNNDPNADILSQSFESLREKVNFQVDVNGILSVFLLTNKLTFIDLRNTTTDLIFLIGNIFKESVKVEELKTLLDKNAFDNKANEILNDTTNILAIITHEYRGCSKKVFEALNLLTAESNSFIFEFYVTVVMLINVYLMYMHSSFLEDINKTVNVVHINKSLH
jgi:hypothetical protein